MSTKSRALVALSLAGALGLGALSVACGDTDEAKPAKKAETAKKAEAAKPAPKEASDYTPLQEALKGPPAETVILAQAWFRKDAAGKSKAGPARMLIYRKGADNTWTTTKLEDGDSNVFHKAILGDDGSILTIGATKAKMKRWTHADGKWSQETLWEKSWGGQFDRLRDIEIGDVDGDGKDEYVIATHDNGVIAIYNPPENGGKAEIIELDQKADTFVHEIEIGDIEGDDKLEFFATPSARNQANKSQPGEIVMYKYTDGKYVRSVIDGGDHTHAKEILAHDVDHDGKSEFFGVLEAELQGKAIKKPVEIKMYTPKEGGGFAGSTVGTITDRQTRFLVAADFDGDGFDELVAASMKTGLFLIDGSVDDKGTITWQEPKNFEKTSSGFEHAAIPADLDGDGKVELYVAADDQRELKRYDWDAEKGTFVKQKLGVFDPMTFTWNIATGKL